MDDSRVGGRHDRHLRGHGHVRVKTFSSGVHAQGRRAAAACGRDKYRLQQATARRTIPNSPWSDGPGPPLRAGAPASTPAWPPAPGRRRRSRRAGCRREPPPRPAPRRSDPAWLRGTGGDCDSLSSRRRRSPCHRASDRKITGRAQYFSTRAMLCRYRRRKASRAVEASARLLRMISAMISWCSSRTAARMSDLFL